MASNDTDTDTDTGSDVIRSNKKYISTTGEYNVAFSLWPSTAVVRLQSNVCERRGRSKKFSIEGVLRTTVDRRNMQITDVARDDR